MPGGKEHIWKFFVHLIKSFLQDVAYMLYVSAPPPGSFKSVDRFLSNFHDSELGATLCAVNLQSPENLCY
jgi:hypothetical protein